MPGRDTSAVISMATESLNGLSGHVFDVVKIGKPVSPDAAVNLSKVISKLSPLLSNLIEFATVECLKDRKEFEGAGKWIRQDPGFPDIVFSGVEPLPGFEIKSWFPLGTEITARFKDSRKHFIHDNTWVCLLAWLPQHIIHGELRILDVVVVSGASVARARDTQYHKPPDYLVLEPEDTTSRPRNLQQTNTNGYKLQATDPVDLAEAAKIVRSWGPEGQVYRPTPEYQSRLRELLSGFGYRLDTNYAKLDRILHPEIEAFKSRVMMTEVEGLTVRDWGNLLRSKDEALVKRILEERLGITEGDAD